MQRAVADCTAAVVEVENRSEAEVHPDRAELGADHVADGARRGAPLLPVALPQPAELAHRRDSAEAFAEALHAPALVVDADGQSRVAQLLDLFAKNGQLFRILVI